jgi:hypothetical protein
MDEACAGDGRFIFHRDGMIVLQPIELVHALDNFLELHRIELQNL